MSIPTVRRQIKALIEEAMDAAVEIPEHGIEEQPAGWVVYVHDGKIFRKGTFYLREGRIAMHSLEAIT